MSFIDLENVSPFEIKGEGCVGGFLFTRLFNAARTYRNDKHKRHTKTFADEQGAHQRTSQQPQPPEAAMKTELQKRIEQALTRLSKEEREAIELTHVEELTRREAARRVGLSIMGFQARYQNALAHLRTLMKAEQGDK